MTAAERNALAQITGYAAANRIRIEGHAHRRMRERRVGYEDLRRALCTATSCKDQRTDSSRRADWKVSGGKDLDSDELECAVNLDGGIVVVTIY